MPYKLVASPTHLLALIPGKRKAIEVRYQYQLGTYNLVD